jgi:hypothetical protein
VIPATYRVVFYTPDPVLGTRLAVGAIVTVGGRDVFVASPSLPTATALGGPRRHQLLGALLCDLRAGLGLTMVGRLSGHLTTGPAVAVPAGVADPPTWVETHVLSRALEGPRKTGEGRRVGTVTARLRELEIDDVVRRKFQPARDLPEWLRRNAEPGALPTVAQFVPGQLALVLLEPIVPDRANAQKQVAQAVQRFAAYRVFAEAERATLDQVQCVAYLVGGGDRERKRTLKGELTFAAHDVLDVDSPNDATRLVRIVREAHASGLPELIPKAG